MKSSPKKILEQIRQIEKMERGKLCPMGGGRYYNHQTWLDGRNVVQYVSAKQVDSIQEAIEGYQRYMELTQTYAELIIQRTRRRRAKDFPKKPRCKR